MVLAEAEAIIVEVPALNKSQSEFQVIITHSISPYSFGGAKILSLRKEALIPSDITQAFTSSVPTNQAS
jgi:hypothetical protein